MAKAKHRLKDLDVVLVERIYAGYARFAILLVDWSKVKVFPRISAKKPALIQGLLASGLVSFGKLRPPKPKNGAIKILSHYGPWYFNRIFYGGGSDFRDFRVEDYANNVDQLIAKHRDLRFDFKCQGPLTRDLLFGLVKEGLLALADLSDDNQVIWDEQMGARELLKEHKGLKVGERVVFVSDSFGEYFGEVAKIYQGRWDVFAVCNMTNGHACWSVELSLANFKDGYFGRYSAYECWTVEAYDEKDPAKPFGAS